MKKIGLLLILAFTTFFSSCEKDLYEDAIQSESKIIFKNVSVNEILKSNPKFKQSFAKIKDRQTALGRGIVYDSIYNFFIDEENGKYIQTENSTTYTFPIYRAESDKIENIIFKLNDDNEYDISTIKYDITKEALESTNYEGTAPIIDYDILYSKIHDLEIKVVTILMCCNDGAGHQGTPHSAGPNCTNNNFLYTITIFISSPSNSGNSSTIGIGTNTSSGGGTITTTPTSGNFTTKQINFITSLGYTGNYIHIFNNQNILNYINNAVGSQLTKAKYFFNNVDNEWLTQQSPNQLEELYQYLISNDFSQDSFMLVSTCAESMMQNPNFSINNNSNTNNSLNLTTFEEYNTFINSLSENIEFEIEPTIQTNDTKVAKAKFKVNGFTYFNVELQQNTNPWNLLNVSSSISGNTFGLSYNQLTPSNGAQVISNGNVRTITFSGDLNLNLFIEGLGTIYTSHLTFIILIDSSTGNVISGQLIGLP